jgi:hypothetical protein
MPEFLSNDDESGRRASSSWLCVPAEFQYLHDYAVKWGTRGLTVDFSAADLECRLSAAELLELSNVYKTIAAQGQNEAISTWCHSVKRGHLANEAKEQIRGLLLLFEKLGEADIQPFTDGDVRFLHAELKPFDWSRLPPRLSKWVPWLRRFETLRTEADLFRFLSTATKDQLSELVALNDALKNDGRALLEWCEANNKKSNPDEHEAFQAEWLFVLVDLANGRLPAT